MYCHDANLIRGAVNLALNFQIVRLHPHQKTGQAGRRGALIAKRLSQQGVNPILCLCPQARQQLLASAMPGKDPLNQLIGPQKVDIVPQIIENAKGLGKVALAVS